MIKTIARALVLGPKLSSQDWNFNSLKEYIEFFEGWVSLRKNHAIKTLLRFKEEGKKDFRIKDYQEISTVFTIDQLIAELHNIKKEEIVKRAEYLYNRKVERLNLSTKMERFLTGNYAFPVYESLMRLIISRFLNTYERLRKEYKFKESILIPEEALLTELLKNNGTRQDELYFKLIATRGIPLEEFTKNGLVFVYQSFKETMTKYHFNDHETMLFLYH